MVKALLSNSIPLYISNIWTSIIYLSICLDLLIHPVTSAPSLAIQLPEASNANVSEEISLNGRSNVQCGPLRFGDDLNEQSCELAWQSIPRNEDGITFTSQDLVIPPDIAIPRRFLSRE